jgi:ABC-2 type transport system ATP-binding protein
VDVITLAEVGKSFGRKEILRDVSLRIEDGRTYGLVGPNGAGKSVLLPRAAP